MVRLWFCLLLNLRRYFKMRSRSGIFVEALWSKVISVNKFIDRVEKGLVCACARACVCVCVCVCLYASVYCLLFISVFTYQKVSLYYQMFLYELQLQILKSNTIRHLWWQIDSVKRESYVNTEIKMNKIQFFFFDSIYVIYKSS